MAATRSTRAQPDPLANQPTSDAATDETRPPLEPACLPAASEHASGKAVAGPIGPATIGTDRSSTDPTGADAVSLTNSLTNDRLVVLPFYHDLRNAIVRPERVKLQTDYFWQRWVPLLGPVRAMVVMRMRQYGYYNRQTRELRDECSRTYDEIASSIGISTRSLERYFESEPDPAGGAYRVLKDPLLGRFIRLRHQYVWRPGKSAPERTTNEYKIAMDEPLTPEDEAALRQAAVARLTGQSQPTDEPAGEHNPDKPRRRASASTRQIGAYATPTSDSLAEPGANLALTSADESTRHSDGNAPVTCSQAGDRQSGAAISPDTMAAQPVVPRNTKQQQTTNSHGNGLPSDRDPRKAGTSDSAPESQPKELVGSLEQVIATFEEANDRPATRLERRIIEDLAAEFATAAATAGRSASDYLRDAIIEAVSSGSRYVAPKRVREICRRWAAEQPDLTGRSAAARQIRGRSATESGPLAVADSDLPVANRRPIDRLAPARLAARPAPRSADWAGDVPQRQTAATLIEVAHYAESSEPADSHDDERANGAMSGAPAKDDESSGQSVFVVSPALGLTNKQLWAAVLDDLRTSASTSTYQTWLKPTRLVGQEGKLGEPEGMLIVGAPNSFARDWLVERYADEVARAVAAVLGQRRRIRFEVY